MQFAIEVPLDRRHGTEGIAKVVTGERTQRLGIDVIIRLDPHPELTHLMVDPNCGEDRMSFFKGSGLHDGEHPGIGRSS